MSRLKPIFINDEESYISFSFDIDDFIGDGIWYLQIYDINHNLIYDRPFASSGFSFNEKEIIKKVREVIYYG
jgi:hypothetical protein